MFLGQAASRLEQFFLSHDLVRVVPNASLRSGYLYAYLASWIGQALLTKDQYGSAIKHLEAHHVDNIPVPLLSSADMDEIADKIERAYGLRDEANMLLDEADSALYRELGLPLFGDLSVQYLPVHSSVDSGTLGAFAVSATAISRRLDASYHNPTTAAVAQALRAGRYAPTQLGLICDRIFYPGRFKRRYVDQDYGVPFIQGSHIPLMQPYEQKYLARNDDRNLRQCRVSKDWVLMTCSGTIGRVGLVSNRADGWAASQHLVRLVPREPEYNPGYIASFLMTPYGQRQVQSKIYGAVVDELTSDDLAEVLIPDAPKEIQDAIGNRVLRAYELKDEAIAVERAAVRMLEDRLEEP